VKKISQITFLVIISSGSYLLYFHTEFSCELSDGRWASNGLICVPPTCCDDSSCGNLVISANNCTELDTGDPISEVYFQLGDSKSVSGRRHLWSSFKGGGENIVATIENETLRALECPSI